MHEYVGRLANGLVAVDDDVEREFETRLGESQSSQLTSAADKVSGEVWKVDVTPTVVK